MAIKNIEFIQIEAVLDSLGRKQIGVEPDVDSELNFRMWGGKDSTGALTHWLAKNKPGLLHSLRLSSLAGQSQSIAKIDANGNIVRGSSDNEDYNTIEHILDLSTLGEENTTFNVVLTANHNNAISFVGSSEQTAIVAIEIEDGKPYNIQIVGACTLAITGVEWWSDAITDITNKSEINIMNGRAMGVLIDV